MVPSSVLEKAAFFILSHHFFHSSIDARPRKKTRKKMNVSWCGAASRRSDIKVCSPGKGQQRHESKQELQPVEDEQDCSEDELKPQHERLQQQHVNGQRHTGNQDEERHAGGQRALAQVPLPTWGTRTTRSRSKLWLQLRTRPPAAAPEVWSHRKRSWESPGRGRAASEPHPGPDYWKDTAAQSLQQSKKKKREK